jgi:hypothetical protein
MKRCPTCQRTYADDSLRFCLDDGTVLVNADDSPASHDPNATLALGADYTRLAPPQKDILDPRTAPTVETPSSTTRLQQKRLTERVSPSGAAPPSSSSSNRALTAGVISIAILLLALVGIGIAMLLRGGPAATNTNTATANSNAGAANSNASANTSPETNANNVERPTTTTAPLKVTATASSTREPLRGISYAPQNALDGQLGSAWLEGATGPGIGEWIRCDFDREIKLRRLLIAPGYFKSSQIWSRNNRVASATLSFSDGSSREFRFPDRMEEQKLELGGIKTSWVRIRIDEVYFGTDPDTAISQLAFDWEP